MTSQPSSRSSTADRRPTAPRPSTTARSSLRLRAFAIRAIVVAAVVLQPLESIIADTGSHHIRYLTRQDYALRYPGITPVRPGDHPALLHVRVDNLPTCEALLKKNGVTFLEPNPGRVLVPPSEAAHLTIAFEER